MGKNGSWENTTEVGDEVDIVTPAPVSLLMPFTYSLAIVIACTATFLNYLVLLALKTVKHSKLWSKFLIQTSCLADVSFAWSSAGQIIVYTLQPLGYKDAWICVSGIQLALAPISQFCQSFSSLALSIDRLYAVWKPLRYYTIGYNKTSRVLFGCLPWILSLLFWSPCILVPVVRGTIELTASNGVCYVLYNGFHLFTKEMHGPLLMAINCVCFLVNVVLFVKLRWHRATMASLDEAKREEQNTLSLAITYFMISFGTLCLYIPHPLYGALVLTPNSITNDPDLQHHSRAISRMLINLYASNTIFTPLLLMVRVSVIRQNVVNIFEFAKKVKNESSCPKTEVSLRSIRDGTETVR